jgi:hypothetical protein
MKKAASPSHQLRFDNAVMPENAAFSYAFAISVALSW